MPWGSCATLQRGWPGTPLAQVTFFSRGVMYPAFLTQSEDTRGALRHRPSVSPTGGFCSSRSLLGGRTDTGPGSAPSLRRGARARGPGRGGSQGGTITSPKESCLGVTGCLCGDRRVSLV